MSMDNKAQFEPYNIASREATKRTWQRNLARGVRNVLRGGTGRGLIVELEKYTRAMTGVNSSGEADPSGIVGEALSQLQGAGFLTEWNFRPLEALHKPLVVSEPTEGGKTRLRTRIAVKNDDPNQPWVQGNFTFETSRQEAETLVHQLWTRLQQLDRQVGYVLPKGAHED